LVLLAANEASFCFFKLFPIINVSFRAMPQISVLERNNVITPQK
jgi:hypothetical protein